MSPQEAFEAHTVDLGFKSSGTWAVSTKEVEQIDLPIIYDGDQAGYPEHHVSIDMSEASRAQLKQMSRKLRDFAEARGCLYSP